MKVFVDTSGIFALLVKNDSMHSRARESFNHIAQIIWSDKEWYARAVQRLFLQNQKDISLVDCLSFEIMESLDISLAFAFDRHFEDMGFSIVS
jgi:predicted nucleic acid-binding protein